VSAPPRNYGQRLGVIEGTSPRELPCHCTDKAGNICPVPLHIQRAVLLLLRRRRGASGNGLGTSAKYLRQTTSGAAGNGLGATIKYLRHTTSAAGIGMDTTAKYLRRTAK
jgi:hypothetical protein